ncbi:MAG: HEPN domain-containing protein [Candidatus Omnitrophica bacterium]|nr:HEPN domain-containing protein [Candidatus Omnitrophota bacterium]
MKQNNLIILAKEWFEKGNHDLDEAKLSFEHGGWTDIICFHCQQAAEKYLKGFLVSQGVNIGKLKKWQIHELPKLWKECNKLNRNFKSIEEECIVLNGYYIEPRYPLGEPKVYSKKEAKEAIEATEKIVSFIISVT